MARWVPSPSLPAALPLLLAALALTPACVGVIEGGGVAADDDQPPTVDDDPERDPQVDPPENDGEGELVDSCSGYCDDITPSGCWCDPDCFIFGDCCEDIYRTCGYEPDFPDPEPDPEPDPDPDPDPTPTNQICYGSTCFPLRPGPVTSGYSYVYPSPLKGSAQYRVPLAFVDRLGVDEDIMLAPNFRLSEFTTRSINGERYIVLQPHALDKLQEVRNAVGPLRVSSGYRAPGHNAEVGGATHSRHMFGDGFDLQPQSVSLTTLKNACDSRGAKTFVYTSHIHCDWRDMPLDPLFFGALFSGETEPAPAEPVAAILLRSPSGFTAPATGFDEGEPLRVWRAYDGRGTLLEEATGRNYAPPAGATSLTVEVGGQVLLRRDLELAAN